jgi:hypothetical protein
MVVISKLKKLNNYSDKEIKSDLVIILSRF